MIKQVLLLLLFFKIFTINGQDTIFFRLANGPFNGVKLAQFYADRLDVLDSAFTNSAGDAKFGLKPKQHYGQYAILLGDTLAFDFFYVGKPIQIRTHVNQIIDSLHFIGSEENTDYQNFVKQESSHELKMNLLNQCLYEYPMDDSFYNQLKSKAISEQINFEAFVYQLIKKYPGAYVANFLNYRRPILSDGSAGKLQNLAYKKLHYFDRVDFGDTSLLHSNAYSRIVISYLGLYSDPKLNFSQQQLAFCEGIKVIMDKASANRMVYEFVVTYLIDGFERFGFQEVLNFISDYYSPGNCENDGLKASVSTKINVMRKMQPGNKAPNLIGNLISGEKFEAAKYNGKWKLIVFWSSTCPHCDLLLPKLHDYYKSQSQAKWEVIAYAIETDKAKWMNYAEAKKYTWPQLSELKGWESKTVANYGISATPSLYFIDANNVIVAKPSNLYELKQLLLQHKLL